jgi:hypothetical protein
VSLAPPVHFRSPKLDPPWFVSFSFKFLNLILPSGSPLGPANHRGPWNKAVTETEILHSRRDYVRYNMKHSILPEGDIGGVFVPRGQRLSIMMRVRLPSLFSYNRPVLTCGLQDMPSMEKSSKH